jgi:enoyl-[acyl-carrier-protein] reductase (NADH)
VLSYLHRVSPPRSFPSFTSAELIAAADPASTSASRASSTYTRHTVFRALGAELAVTYHTEKARKFVEPLAKELEAKPLLAHDAARLITGETLYVNGGYHVID